MTHHFRGEETILHVDESPHDLAQRLGAVPARDGLLTILRAPGPIAFEGARPRAVHPLLVYTELAISGDERAREASAEILEPLLAKQR